MPESRNIIAILGGTFDPVHFGHLRTALELYEQLPLQEVRFIPCQQPVHKPNALASPEHRLAMLELAIQDQPGFVADAIELERTQPSYTVHTLEQLRQNASQSSFAFILGQDAFRGLTTWYEWRRLLQLTHLIVVTRPQTPLDLPQPMTDLLEQHRAQQIHELTTTSHGKIWLTAVTPLTISASFIRQQLNQGLSPRYLLPDTVCNYIEKYQLYSGS